MSKDSLDKTINPAGEPWRDEVASRVNSYKARRVQRSAAMSLDFETPRASAAPAPAAGRYDTNYYRRVNAATRGVELSGALQGAYVPTATAPDYAVVPTTPEPAPSTASANPFAPPSREPALDQRVPSSLLEPPAPQASAASPVDDEAEAIGLEEEPQTGGYGSIELDAPAAEPARPSCQTPAGAPQEEERPAAARQDNLIEFPRAAMEPPLAPEPAADQLAEPVFAAPRILDVPEEMTPEVQGNLFDGLTLDSPEELSSQPEPRPEAPLALPTAALGLRLGASLVDLLLVAGATTMFLAIANHAVFDLPKQLMAVTLALIAATLWAVYQYVFLRYAGRTMGMEMLRLRVRTLSGGRPGPRARRRRAICTVLSLLTVGFGHLLAWVDRSGLCWHDRSSRTYVEQTL